MALTANSKVLEVSGDNFQTRVIEAERPFLLDLSAEWCGPCKALAPVVEELAGVYAERVDVGKLDIDASPDVPTRYQVRSVPTLIMFDKGEVIGQLVGVQPRQKIVDLIEKAGIRD